MTDYRYYYHVTLNFIIHMTNIMNTSAMNRKVF